MDQAEKNVQQVRVIKDRNGNALSSEAGILPRWTKCFEELINEEHDNGRRLDGEQLMNKEVQRVSKEEVRAAIKRMKSATL